MRRLILFSPSIILVLMTIVVAMDENLKNTTLAAMLGVLAISVAAAEVVRYQLRRESREVRERAEK